MGRTRGADLSGLTAEEKLERHRAQVRATNRARNAAQLQLIARHPERFEELYEQEAAKQGVIPTHVRQRRRKTPAQIEAEIARLQRQLDQLRRDMNGHGDG